MLGVQEEPVGDAGCSLQPAARGSNSTPYIQTESAFLEIVVDVQSQPLRGTEAGGYDQQPNTQDHQHPHLQTEQGAQERLQEEGSTWTILDLERVSVGDASAQESSVGLANISTAECGDPTQPEESQIEVGSYDTIATEPSSDSCQDLLRWGYQRMNALFHDTFGVSKTISSPRPSQAESASMMV